MKLRGLLVLATLTIALCLVSITLVLAQAGTLLPSDSPPPGSVASPTNESPAIILTKTVGIDPNVCATTTVITITNPADVTYCYYVTNTGIHTLTLHRLDDTEVGPIINDYLYTLAPSASAFLTASTGLTQTTVNTATWTAYNPGPIDVATATATATVNVLTPSIELKKTVGTDPMVCATADLIEVKSGTTVTYCYEVTNTGTLTLTLHDLDDTEVGPIIKDFPYTLAPSASAFITTSAELTRTTVNTATWTAYNPGPSDVVTATAVAVVNVVSPAIHLIKTVGTNPNVCAAANNIEVSSGTTVTYCYQVTNTGTLTLTLHDLDDNELGPILNDLPYALAPSASAFVTSSVELTRSTVNTATWTAFNPGPSDVVTATAAATVTVAAIGAAPEIAVTPAALAVELPPGGQVAKTITISNSGNTNLTWTIFFAPKNCLAPGDVAWVEVDRPAGTTLPSAVDEIVLAFDATGTTVGDHAGVLCIGSNDPDEPIVAVHLTLTIGPEKLYLPITVKPSG